LFLKPWQGWTVPFEIQCPKCARRYVLTDDRAGERVRCTECAGIIQTPLHGMDADGTPRTEAGIARQRRRALLRKALIGLRYGAVLLGVSLIVLAVVAVPPVWQAHSHIEIGECRADLERIAIAMLDYAAGNGDALPFDERGPQYSLALLYPDYLKDPAVFICPAAPHADIATFPESGPLRGGAYSYVYDYRGAADTKDPEMIILRDSPGSHSGKGGNLLFADGRVEWRERAPVQTR
jgi:prepilin-type processing-associated H-X9-DG protein